MASDVISDPLNIMQCPDSQPINRTTCGRGHHQVASHDPGDYLSLYAVTDLFSRFIVAWMVSLKENSTLATQLMNEAVCRYAIEPAQLTLHQDRGSPMTAHGYLDDMKQLDITCSHSRPRARGTIGSSDLRPKRHTQSPSRVFPPGSNLAGRFSFLIPVMLVLSWAEFDPNSWFLDFTIHLCSVE